MGTESQPPKTKQLRLSQRPASNDNCNATPKTQHTSCSARAMYGFLCSVAAGSECGNASL